MFENVSNMSTFAGIASEASLNENIKHCFLKEVVNLKQFVIKKSDKIGKSRNPIKKRHLTIFAVLS